MSKPQAILFVNNLDESKPFKGSVIFNIDWEYVNAGCH